MEFMLLWLRCSSHHQQQFFKRFLCYYIAGTGNSTVSQNTIGNFLYYGVNSNAAGTIDSNTITDSGTGILANHSAAVVRGNTVSLNDVEYQDTPSLEVLTGPPIK